MLTVGALFDWITLLASFPLIVIWYVPAGVPGFPVPPVLLELPQPGSNTVIAKTVHSANRPSIFFRRELPETNPALISRSPGSGSQNQIA